MGTGRIGAAMARICHGYGMTVLAYDQYQNPALEGIVRYVSLEELLRGSDLISLHCPLTAQTRHLINAGTIAMIRDSAILVNTSRGGLIDTDALIDALRQGKFAGVGLDVYEDEDGQVFEDFSNEVLQNQVVPILTSFPNVVVTSHQAFFTRTALQSIAITTMETPAPLPAARPWSTRCAPAADPAQTMQKSPRFSRRQARGKRGLCVVFCPAAGRVIFPAVRARPARRPARPCRRRPPAGPRRCSRRPRLRPPAGPAPPRRRR